MADEFDFAAWMALDDNSSITFPVVTQRNSNDQDEDSSIKAYEDSYCLSQDDILHPPKANTSMIDLSNPIDMLSQANTQEVIMEQFNFDDLFQYHISDAMGLDQYISLTAEFDTPLATQLAGDGALGREGRMLAPNRYSPLSGTPQSPSIQHSARANVGPLWNSQYILSDPSMQHASEKLSALDSIVRQQQQITGQPNSNRLATSSTAQNLCTPSAVIVPQKRTSKEADIISDTTAPPKNRKITYPGVPEANCFFFTVPTQSVVNSKPRKRGKAPCLKCKTYKKKCEGGFPCTRCQEYWRNALRPSLWWSECFDSDIEKLNIFPISFRAPVETHTRAFIDVAHGQEIMLKSYKSAISYANDLVGGIAVVDDPKRISPLHETLIFISFSGHKSRSFISKNLGLSETQSLIISTFLSNFFFNRLKRSIYHVKNKNPTREHKIWLTMDLIALLVLIFQEASETHRWYECQGDGSKMDHLLLYVTYLLDKMWKEMSKEEKMTISMWDSIVSMLITQRNAREYHQQLEEFFLAEEATDEGCNEEGTDEGYNEEGTDEEYDEEVDVSVESYYKSWLLKAGRESSWAN